MLRTLTLLVAFAAAILWVEPSWNRDDRTLRLRVRGGQELLEMGRAQTSRIARWVARETARRTKAADSEEQDRAPVGAPPLGYLPGPGGASGPPSLDRSDEWISRRDQKRLDELILKKSRD